MIQNKVKKILFSIVIAAIMILGIGQNVIYAAGNNGNLTARLTKERYVKSGGVYAPKGIYKIKTNTQPIFQISSFNDAERTGTNFYCLNAKVGATWTDNNKWSDPTEYNRYYILDNNIISEAELGTEYANIKNANTYKQVLWILDNMYVRGQDEADSQAIENIEELLAKAGIVKVEADKYDSNGDGTPDAYRVNGGYKYIYNPDLNVNKDSIFKTNNFINTAKGSRASGYCYGETRPYEPVVLEQQDIEVVQQAAIWYFTNNKALGDTIFDWYTKDINNLIPGLTWDGENNENEKDQCKREQMAILYNYFVDAANKAVEAGYTGTEAGTINLTKTGISIVEDGENYKVGPIKLTTTGPANVTEIVAVTGSEYKTGISKDTITLKDASNKTITVAEASNGENFYVIIPKSEDIRNYGVKITATGKTTTTTKKLWIKEGATGAAIEQPIVEVTKEPEDIDDDVIVKIEKTFDLALRKQIIAINGKNNTNGKNILNEDGLLADRNMNIVKDTIPDTATYKHRKDPVVVNTGDTVTYRISIYNEGDIDGYASIIVDQLPTGLTTKLKVGDKVTSKVLNNEYKVTSVEGNKITLEIISATPASIPAYNKTTLSSDYIDLDCEVEQTSATDGRTKHYLTNIAYIAEARDNTNTVVEADRDGKESKPAEHPTETADDLNNTNKDTLYKGNEDNESIYKDTNNEYYYKGQQDDDDFETVVVLPKEFDLKLVKYIAEIDGVKSDRKITVDSSKLNKTENGKKITTADYDVSKVPLTVKTGDYVKYTFRIYNEGDIDGYAEEITEDIPAGLEFVYDRGVTVNPDGSVNFDNATIELSDKDKAAMEFNIDKLWSVASYDRDDKIDTISTTYLSKDVSTDNLIKAYDEKNDDGKGSGLSYKEVSVMLKVTSTDPSKIIRNEAEISKDADEKGDDVTDRDSKPEEWNKEDSDDNYEDNPNYPKYEEDDEDYDNIKLAEFDLALRKFITSVSTDGDFSNTTTTTYDRVPKVDTTKLKTGAEDTAIYNHSKDPISLKIGDYILYTIRVYNEGSIPGYASEITDYLPEYLDFIDSTDEYISSINGDWTYDAKTRKVTTKKLAKRLLAEFNATEDNGAGSGLDYADVQIICKINKKAVKSKKITNIAEITEYRDENENITKTDRDSESDDLKYPEDESEYEGDREGPNASDTYYPGQEDDDDFEKVEIKDFDLALRKFITDIGGKEVTTRIPQVSYKDGKITYTHPKDVLKVIVGDVVTYTIRVYNEGDIAGFAQTVTDDIPEYLEYLPENKTNIKYRWVMYDKDGKETKKVSEAVKIVTDYTSKEQGEALMASDSTLKENPNLLNAFNPKAKITNTNPDYVDVKVAFKVLDPNSNKHIIVNKAQISEDADEKGNPIDDIDSIPNKWNKGEDDQDYENVSVEYFDLSLLKYVSKVIVTENGTTTTTKTGNTGADTDIIPKVEIYRKSIKSTVVKFAYTIKITNEGDIAGYAKEITDYVPEGLKFYKEDNQGWTDEGKNVISTKLLENTLLQPGESATVTVTLRWINGENNLNLKTNIAEISKDENDKGVPDRDSTPDNKKEGEDDIDDASVLLTISTGVIGNTMMYIGGVVIILLVLAGGVIAIKKFVL